MREIKMPDTGMSSEKGLRYMPIITQKKLFIKIHIRMAELGISYTEMAAMLNMCRASFSNRMNGKTPWTEPEMQMVLFEIGQPEETLDDFWPRRAV